MSTAPHDQDFPNGVSADDRLDVFASRYAGTALPRAHEGPAVPGSGNLGIGAHGGRSAFFGTDAIHGATGIHGPLAPPDGVSSDDLLDVFASRYNAASAAVRERIARAAFPSAFPSTSPLPNSIPADQAKRCAAALEEAQSLRAELQKRDQKISRTTDVLTLIKWLCNDIGKHLDDDDRETPAEILRHIHTLIGLI